MRKRLFVLLFLSVVLLLSVVVFKQTVLGPKTETAKQTSTTAPTPPPAFDTKKYSTTDPASIWVVVNKRHPLQPKSYVPGDLLVPDVPLRLNAANEQMKVRQIIAEPLKQFISAAKSEGYNLSLGSGFRSYNYQNTLYTGYVRESGQAAADRTSARPGHSEHQTGLVFDVELVGGKCHLDKCLGALPEGKWIAANAYKFGFIVRYPEGKEAVTGYDYEPWHLRYIGTELAEEMRAKNIVTLEEFFDISGGTSY